MRQRQAGEEPRARVARHRRNLEAAGVKRVEVLVPSADVALVREVAATLRRGGEDARRAREGLAPLFSGKRARTGRELLAFLRASPLVGEDLDLERDRSTGRPIDL